MNFESKVLQRSGPVDLFFSGVDFKRAASKEGGTVYARIVEISL
jgi:hypothetical protein